MADETGWSEKGKSGRGKRPPKDSSPSRDAIDDAREALDDIGDDVVDDIQDDVRGDEPRSATPKRPSKRDTSAADKGESTVVRRPSGDAGARKVARAAATAGQRDASFVSRLGFPALIAAICLLGLLAVIYARGTRDALATPRQNLDHWHAVYGVYDCTQPGDEKYLPPFQSARDVNGIHSHGDGIIHVHPFFEISSGANATISHFYDEMGIQVGSDSIVLDNGRELVAGTECADGSGPAEIRVLRWQFDFEALGQQAPTDVFTEDLGAIKFDNDREVYIIAFANPSTFEDPEDLPLPPQGRFDGLNSVSSALQYNPGAELLPQDSGITVEGTTEDGETIELELETDN